MLQVMLRGFIASILKPEGMMKTVAHKTVFIVFAGLCLVDMEFRKVVETERRFLRSGRFVGELELLLIPGFAKELLGSYLDWSGGLVLYGTASRHLCTHSPLLEKSKAIKTGR